MKTNDPVVDSLIPDIQDHIKDISIDEGSGAVRITTFVNLSDMMPNTDPESIKTHDSVNRAIIALLQHDYIVLLIRETLMVPFSEDDFEMVFEMVEPKEHNLSHDVDGK